MKHMHRNSLEHRWNMTTEQINRRMKYMRTEWGMSDKAIADELGCSVTAVAHRLGDKTDAETKVIKAAGRAKAAAARKDQFERRKRKYVPIMQAYREEGYSNEEIAKKTGFCSKSVRNYIGVEPDEIHLAALRVGAAKRHLRHMALVKMADEASTQKAIAETATQIKLAI